MEQRQGFKTFLLGTLWLNRDVWRILKKEYSMSRTRFHKVEYQRKGLEVEKGRKHRNIKNTWSALTNWAK